MVQFLIEQNVNRAASRCTHYIKICLSVKWLDSKTRMQVIQPYYTLICSYAVQKCESTYLSRTSCRCIVESKPRVRISKERCP